MNRPVLIVIDMLRDFLDSWDASRKHHLLESINQLTGEMRSRVHPVIWVRQEFEPDLRDAFLEMKAKALHKTVRGTAGSEIVPELVIAPSDIVIVKKRYSAFFGTNLDETLVRLGCRSIILAGVNTHACIRMTAIDAYQRDWPVALALDCIDSYDLEHHEISVRYMRDKIATVMTNQQILAAL